MKKNINNKGITLVALVITIIVMLILAGVTIAVVVNGGLFGQAQKASEETKKASIEEKFQLILAEYEMQRYDTNPKDLETIFSDNWYALEELNNGYYKITDNNTMEEYYLDEDFKIIRVGGYMQEGLILYYDGINNTGNGHSNNLTVWKDLSGNGNDTISSYSPSWVEDSFVGNNNDSGFLLPDGLKNIISSRNFTMEFVFKANEVNARDILIGNFNITPSFNIERNSSAFLDTSSRLYWKGGNPDVKLQNAKTETEKTSLVISVNDNTIKSYIKGQKKDEIVITLPNIIPTNLYLGRDTRIGGTTFGGNIYAVRIYSRALTEDEVNQNYVTDKVRFGL